MTNPLTQISYAAFITHMITIIETMVFHEQSDQRIDPQNIVKWECLIISTLPLMLFNWIITLNKSSKQIRATSNLMMEGVELKK